MCEYPGKPRHGEVSGDFPGKFRPVATFSCAPGYQLEGSDAVVCLADGRWSNTRPQCKRKYLCHIFFFFAHILVHFIKSFVESSSGSRISKTGKGWRWGANSWEGGKNLLFDKIFAENCMKMKEIGPIGHACPPGSAKGFYV